MDKILDPYLIERIAQHLMTARDYIESCTYYALCDTVRFARTCHYIHDIVAPIIARYIEHQEQTVEVSIGSHTDPKKRGITYYNEFNQIHRYLGPASISRKCEEYYIDGQYHRGGGKPAIKKSDGTRVWYVNGLQWRANGLPSRINKRALELLRHGIQVMHKSDIIFETVALMPYNKRRDYGTMEESHAIVYEPYHARTIELYEVPHSYNGNPGEIYGDGMRMWYHYGELHREDGPAIEEADGTRKWYRYGKLHREDGPAIEHADGTRKWYRDGKHHRKDGPAVEHANGPRKWYINGELHREDGPAVEKANGTREWYINSKLHREDGPAVEKANGTREWYINGKLHREDGPAVERADGTRKWFRDGRRHREDGPAVEHVDGTRKWFRDGRSHREDGPAVERADGTREWFRNGRYHREDGPAIEYNCGLRIWFRDGWYHHEDGPAIRVR